MKINTVLLPNGKGLPLPAHQSSQAAGLDLYAAVDATVEVLPGQTALIPCGFALELPQGYEAQVRPRSGLALKKQITVLNSPGTIDSDYRGEVKVILINHGLLPFKVNRGDRVAQMVIARHETVTLVECSELSVSERGAGGYGSTGISN